MLTSRRRSISATLSSRLTVRLGTTLFAAATLAIGACDAATPTAPKAATPSAPQSAARPVDSAPVELPALTGRVVDQAALLSTAQESRLTAMLEQLEARTTDQLVIVTIPDLGNQTIEQFSMALGNIWGIGQASKDNGVLLVIAPTHRQTRIEVGYGLEPILTDRQAKEIIDRDLLPYFREARWFEGIEGATRAISSILVENAAVPRRGHS